MRIVIPTFMRESAQTSFRRLPKSLQDITTLYTHSGRAGLLRKANPDAMVHDLGKTDGIADVRQKILDHCDGEKILMIDDSCHFYKRYIRPEDGKPSTTGMEEADWHDMLRQASDLLDMYPQVGISPKPGNNRYEGELRDIGRTYTVFALDTARLKREGIRFDDMYRKNPEIKLYEDFYLTLSMLTKGIPNAIMYNFVFNAPHGRAGGNSVHRTHELHGRCAEALAAEFPEFVKVVKVVSKTWNSGDGTRTEVQIAWKKAYESGVRARREGGGLL